MPEIHESDHAQDSTGNFEEPPGGWIDSRQLVDTELLVTVLCKFTGRPLTLWGGQCPDRLEHRHPDLWCRAFYVQAEAARDGRLDLAGFGDVLPEEVRVPLGGGEPTGRPHVS